MSKPKLLLPAPTEPRDCSFTLTLGPNHISAHAENLTCGELRFLGEVISLMCDPAKAAAWEQFKAGKMLLAYNKGEAIGLTYQQVMQILVNMPRSQQPHIWN